MKSKEMEEQIEIKVSPRLAWAVLAGKGGMLVVWWICPWEPPRRPLERSPPSAGHTAGGP